MKRILSIFGFLIVVLLSAFTLPTTTTQTAVRVLRDGTHFNETYVTADLCNGPCKLLTILINGVFTLNQNQTTNGQYRYYANDQETYVRVESIGIITVDSPDSPKRVLLNYESTSVPLDYEVVALNLTHGIKLYKAQDTFSLVCQIRRQMSAKVSFKWHFAFPTDGNTDAREWIEVSRLPEKYTANTRFRAAYTFSFAEYETTSMLSLVQTVAGQTLSYQQPTAAYAGRYRCLATLGAGLASTIHEDSIVLAAPMALAMPTDKMQYWDNEAATLAILVFGNPVPDVWWQKSNTSSGAAAVPIVAAAADTSGKYTLTSHGMWNKLTVSNLELSDRAFYMCTARNSLGNGTAELLLRVRNHFMVFYPSVGLLVEILLLIVCMAACKRKSTNVDEEPSTTDLTRGRSAAARKPTSAETRRSQPQCFGVGPAAAVASAAAGMTPGAAEAGPAGSRKHTKEDVVPLRVSPSSLHQTPKTSVGALCDPPSKHTPMSSREPSKHTAMSSHERQPLWQEAKSIAAAAAAAEAAAAATAAEEVQPARAVASVEKAYVYVSPAVETVTNS